MKTATLPNGLTASSPLPRPFFVRKGGTGRAYASLAAARAAEPGSQIFFDYAPGCGHFLEHVGG